jgi:hypothetical protein
LTGWIPTPLDSRRGRAMSSADALPASPARGLTVADVASRYRVSPDKVRAWIRRGELAAVNTATTVCGKPRWVIPPEALSIFEQRRSSTAPTKPPRRRRQLDGWIDYYPGT